MRNVLSMTLLIVLASAVPVGACIASFGYTGSSVSEIDFLSANVQTGMTHIVVTDETQYITGDAAYLVSKAGPALVDLTDIIFNPTSTTVNCTNYERGSISETVTLTNLRGNYQDRLDTFFAVNADLFQGSRKIYGIIVQNEANNRCVAGWKLHKATHYVETKLAEVAQYSPIYTIVAYGLRNTPAISGRGPTASKGFPVANGAIATFPGNVDVVAYWVYDIFNPNNPSHTFNVNQESWTSLDSKLNQALHSGQKTAIVVKAFCNDNDPVEAWWGVTCPNLATWKLGVAAKNWRDFALNDSRNLFVVGFNWTDFGSIYGSESMSDLWADHSSVQQSVNCPIP